MIYSEPSVELDRYFHIPLLIVTKHKLGLPFPPRNLPVKFGTNPFYNDKMEEIITSEVVEA